MSIAHKALENVVAAWNSTKAGDTTPREIQRWLVEDMKPAIDEARIALASGSETPIGVAQAWALVSAERIRQVSAEGWDAAHDDEHSDGSLLRAAVTYLHHEAVPNFGAKSDGTPPEWPWEAEWWKPRSRYDNVLRAGALCLADRERRIRAGEHTGPADHKLGLCLAALAEMSPLPEAKAA